MRFRSATVCLILVAVSFLGLRKVRAEISEIQPFTAVETHITRVADRPIPNVWTQILAVSGDGQLIAGLFESHLPGRPVYRRTVWNKREKTKINIDPELKMLVVYPYDEPAYLNGGNYYLEDDHLTWGPNCEGTPDGQIEGFYVNLMVRSGTATGKGTTVTKSWAAPKLGCYVFRREETITDASGTVIMTFLQTLSSIKVGEPDPSYFDTSLPKGYSEVLPEDWMDAYINRMKAVKAIGEQQPR
jgi:hypothetical protein